MLAEAEGFAAPERPGLVSDRPTAGVDLGRPRHLRRRRAPRRCSPSCAAPTRCPGRRWTASPASGPCSATPTSCTSPASPKLFSASEGGVVLEDLAPEQPRDDAQHAAGDGPAAARRLPPAAGRDASRPRSSPASRTRSATICRELMAEAAETGRGRVRARRHLAACRRRSSGELMGLPEDDWAHIHDAGRAPDQRARTPTSPAEADPTSARRSRWRCTPSSSPAAAAPSRRARTSPRSSSTATSAASR